ncbi:flippase [Candidatus Pacearchaeota archaeon]|nr:flippase [Candidatus Pacearchaeota archaeon]
MKETKKNKAIALDDSLKLLVKTSFIVFFGIVISKVVTYLYRILIARYLGSEVYGLFSLASMILGLFAAFFSLGLAEGLLRYISFYRLKNSKGKINHLFRKTSLILLISSISAAVLLFLFSRYLSINIFHNSELIIYLRIFSILLPIWIFSSLFLAIIRAYEKISAYSFIFNIVQNASKLIVLALLIWIGLKNGAVISSFFIGTLIVFLSAYFYCKFKFPEIFKKSNLGEKGKKLFKNLFSYSWSIMFFGVVSSLFYWIDSFLIGYFKGVREVGFYNAALPIAAILTLSSEIFIQLFFPLVTKYYSQKKLSLIEDLSKQVGKWVWIINLPMLVLIILFPGVFINILFGPEYLVAENALRFLSISCLFFSLFSISNNLLLMIGKSKLILFDIILASVINLVLNLILIPMKTIGFIDNSYGITGAAIATMISVIIFNILLVLQVRHYISIIPFKRDMIKIFIVTMILVIPVYIISKVISVNLFILLIIGITFAIAYIILILFTGCFDKNDFMIFNSIKRKLLSLTNH